mmetsp:Transcript_17916/g.57728  ORF Transcript_17916/g.57728 Transcript_17916/m.57728 type:complete len:101 (-) Transcript_17916:219-521(-)
MRAAGERAGIELGQRGGGLADFADAGRGCAGDGGAGGAGGVRGEGGCAAPLPHAWLWTESTRATVSSEAAGGARCALLLVAGRRGGGSAPEGALDAQTLS